MNNLDFFITQRNSSSKPLIIWGSAILAKKIAAFLKKRNIPFEGFAVNEMLYQKSKNGCTPKLAISVYHRPFDLINIFTFLKNLNLGYKFYFRNYMPSGVDSILFAVK